MSRQSDRIRWEREDRPAATSFYGRVGSLEPPTFHIWSGNRERWVLIPDLPGLFGERVKSADPEELKARAEEILREFVATLGAVFPDDEETETG